MNTAMRTTAILTALLVLSLPGTALPQPAPIPHHKQAYVLDSGTHTSQAAESFLASRDIVTVSGAPWLQLHFESSNLGARSSVSITSLKDGHTQRFTAKSLSDWQNSTAYFNGDSVEVQLHVAPGEENVFVRLGEVTVGEWASPGPRPETICGTTDDRVASSDPRAGRIVPVGCTGWIISNGAHLTAGHCTGAAMQLLQFNVPPSQANGTIVAPAPEHQYPINAATVAFANNGVGDDWAIFNTNRNATTNLLPVERQGAFYRISRDSNPTTVRVTGFGVDGPGPSTGCPTCDFGNAGPRNSDNQTQQTHTGASLGETVANANNVQWAYLVDTQPANSGSPIMIDGTSLAIGIHTNGGCTTTGGSNIGTGFEHDGLENAINGFVGANARYVDSDHPVVLQDGTAVRPFDTVLEGITDVPLGGIVSLVTGTYPETLTIDRAMTLSAPVGPVHIGP